MARYGFFISDMNERRLIEKTRNGDRDAFELLVEPYIKPLFNYISFRINDVSDANDIIQESLLSMWQSIRSYGHGASFKTWAFSIARRRLADFYRKNKKQDILPLTDYENASAVKDEIDESIKRMDIGKALSQLSCDEKELVILIFQTGLNYREASEVIRVPMGTIKSRMSGIKAKLKNLLGGRGYYNGQL